MEGNASAGTENPEPKYKPMEFDGDPENDPSILSKLKKLCNCNHKCHENDFNAQLYVA